MSEEVFPTNILHEKPNVLLVLVVLVIFFLVPWDSSPSNQQLGYYVFPGSPKTIFVNVFSVKTIVLVRVYYQQILENVILWSLTSRVLLYPKHRSQANPNSCSSPRKMDLSHIDKPAAMLGVFGGETAARGFHEKLVSRPMECRTGSMGMVYLPIH